MKPDTTFAWAVIAPDGFVDRSDFIYSHFLVIPDEYGLTEQKVLERVFCFPDYKKKCGYRAKKVRIVHEE